MSTPSRSPNLPNYHPPAPLPNCHNKNNPRTLRVPAIPAEFSLAGQISFIDTINILPMPGASLFANASSDLYLDSEQRLKTPSGHVLFSNSIKPQICNNLEESLKAKEMVEKNIDLAPLKLLRATLPHDVNFKNPKLHADGAHTINTDPVTKALNDRMVQLQLEERVSSNNPNKDIKTPLQVFYPKYRKTRPRSKKGLEEAMQNRHLIGDPAILAPRACISERNNPQLVKHYNQLEFLQMQKSAAMQMEPCSISPSTHTNSLDPSQLSENSPYIQNQNQPHTQQSRIARHNLNDMKSVINDFADNNNSQGSNDTTPQSSQDNTPMKFDQNSQMQGDWGHVQQNLFEIAQNQNSTPWNPMDPNNQNNFGTPTHQQNIPLDASNLSNTPTSTKEPKPKKTPKPKPVKLNYVRIQFDDDEDEEVKITTTEDIWRWNPVTNTRTVVKNLVKLEVGERVIAKWHKNNNWYFATVVDPLGNNLVKKYKKYKNQKNLAKIEAQNASSHSNSTYDESKEPKYSFLHSGLPSPKDGSREKRSRELGGFGLDDENEFNSTSLLNKLSNKTFEKKVTNKIAKIKSDKIQDEKKILEEKVSVEKKSDLDRDQVRASGDDHTPHLDTPTKSLENLKVNSQEASPIAVTSSQTNASWIPGAEVKKEAAEIKEEVIDRDYDPPSDNDMSDNENANASKVRAKIGIPTRIVKPDKNEAKNSKSQKETGGAPAQAQKSRRLVETKQVLSKKYTSTIYDVGHMKSNIEGEVRNFNNLVELAIEPLEYHDILDILKDYNEDSTIHNFIVPENLLLVDSTLIKLKRQSLKLQRMKVINQTNIPNLVKLMQLLDLNIRLGLVYGKDNFCVLNSRERVAIIGWCGNTGWSRELTVLVNRNLSNDYSI